MSGISLSASTNKGGRVSATEAQRRNAYIMLFVASCHEETEGACWVLVLVLVLSTMPGKV